MRTAFVSIPRLACAVEALRYRRLADQPLIVGDSEQPKRVLDCSFDASERGVRHGMPIRQALGLCPDATVVAPDPVLYRAAWESILDALAEISPEVEDEAQGRAYVNVAGLVAHYGDEPTLAETIGAAIRLGSGIEAGVGIASGKFPALAAGATVCLGETHVIPSGSEASFLAPLSVEFLPVEIEVISRLRLFGLNRIGDVAVLSIPELQTQFGFEGGRLWQLANGIDDQPLRPRQAAETLSDGLTFETPVAGIDVLVAAARQLLSRLRLALRGRAARELTLQAELDSDRGWERRLVLREAVSDGERLAFVLRSSLMNAPPPRAVRRLTLRLSGLTGETGKQLTLGAKARLESQVEESIRQLKARYGHSPIYRCVDVEPWSVIPEDRQILVESDA